MECAPAHACGFSLLAPSPLPPASRARCPSSQISGAGACRASVALHHHLMDSCHSFARLATTSPRPMPRHASTGKGSQASVHTEPACLVNMSCVQHRVYGGFAWRQISASKGQSPSNNAHPCPLLRQIRGRSSNAVWQRQCQPPAEELPAQSGGVFSESRPPSPGWQPLLVSCQASLALAALKIAGSLTTFAGLSGCQIIVHCIWNFSWLLVSLSGPVLPNTGVFTQ